MIFCHYNKIVVVFLFSIALSNASSVYYGFRNENLLLFESKLSLEAVLKALSYLQEHPESLTDDVILGVLITRANLLWINARFKAYLDYPSLKKLIRTMKICDSIINTNKTEIHPILNKQLWENEAEDLKYGDLYEDDTFALPKLDTCESVDAYMMTGTPENSDLCINELFNFSCKISDYCWYSEMNEEVHFGYKTSHRLIYLQSAEKLNCEKINPLKFSGIKNKKKKLCQQMLSEARALHDQPATFPLVRDLFMEQIALCGLEGYEEFASEIWRKEVRSWQESSGCFGLDFRFNSCTPNTLPEKVFAKRVKRTDSVIDNCHTHVTAVGVSALSFYLRYVLNEVFLLP